MTLTPKIDIIGLCGVTCSGKTSLARILVDYIKSPSDSNFIKDQFNNFAISEKIKTFNDLKSSKTIKIESILMDEYFLPINDPRHVLIPELGHINWELMTSINIDKMVSDVTSSIERLKSSGVDYAILIVEGFLVLNCERLKSLCTLCFFVDLDYKTCFTRRSNRAYDPPDIPGYFEKIVWPESQKNKTLVLNSTPDLHLLNGSLPLETNFCNIIDCIYEHIKVS